MKEYKCTICGTSSPEDFRGPRKSMCKKHANKDSAERMVIYKINNFLKYRFSCARVRARNANMEFNITLEYLEHLLKEQDGKCVYTGLEFNNEDGMKSMSLDRIDSTKGYIEGNLQFVLSCINYMKQEYSEKDFVEMCKLVYLNSL